MVQCEQNQPNLFLDMARRSNGVLQRDERLSDMSCERDGTVIGPLMVTCRLRSKLVAITSACSYFCLHFTRQLGPHATSVRACRGPPRAKQPPHGFFSTK